MKLVWSDLAWEDYLYWQERSPETVKKINALIEDTRRITGEHRLVYRVTGNDSAQALEIAQCRYHY
jgi:toxin YoeB